MKWIATPEMPGTSKAVTADGIYLIKKEQWGRFVTVFENITGNLKKDMISEIFFDIEEAKKACEYHNTWIMTRVS